MQQGNQHKTGTRTIEIPNAILIPEIIKYLEQGHTVTLPLKGFSMRPFLESNRDMALLTSPKNIKVGDPVLAEIAPKQYVLHRIININGEHVTLLGDGNLTPEHCLLSNIKASIDGFYRKGRKKLDRTDGRKWKLYSKIWMTLRPLRRWLLAFYRRIWIPIFGTI
jgi:hypothetical protein